MKWPGFKGASIEPGVSDTPMLADDRRLYPLYELCQSMDIPISISLSSLLCFMVNTSYEYSSPLPLYRVGKDFPKLDVVVSHAAYPWVREVLGVAFVCPHIWVSPDLYLVGVNTPGGDDFVKAGNL